MLSRRFPDGASPSTESLRDARETKVKSWTLENRSQFSVPEILIIATGRGATPMPSPFPGMNPFLEQDDAWHDFHEKIIPKIAERLVVQVRPEYIVKIDEHMYVHELPAEPRQASLVEIDLLRGGKPMPLDDLPDRAYAYSVLVSRVEDRPKAGFSSIGLRDRLPIIPVPLRAPANDARLDLQEALNHVYDVSGYEDYIYSGVPDPPLDGKDQDWAENLIPRLKP
jgi:Protein of unknown function (DUF4058)